MNERAVELLKERFGLNTYEAKAYLSLLEGAISPKEVSSKAGIPISRVYDVLKGLALKGFAYQRGRRYEAKRIEAASAAVASRLRNEYMGKLKRIDEAVEELKGLMDHMKRKETVPLRVIEGIDQAWSEAIEVLASSKKVYFVANKALEVKEVLKDLLRASMSTFKGKEVRLLIPMEAKLKKDEIKFLNSLGLKVKKTEAALTDLMVADYRRFLMGIPDPTGKVIAIFLENPMFAGALQRYLDKIWSKG
jgi:sugar-specific transcriptional regulator TrmB